MGEIADMMLDGTLCQHCGGSIGDRKSPGYPRCCPACTRELEAEENRARASKVRATTGTTLEVSRESERSE